jgi:aminomethyltransferase
MRKTPFYGVHEKAGAKIVDFAGYAMPVQYTGIIEEHLRVRQTAGIFDVSHMGEIEIRGAGALEFVQQITLNDVSKLTDGRVQYSAMVYQNGGMIDDMLVYNCGEYYLLVVNASNKEKDLQWILKQAPGNVEVRDVSDDTALLAVQGPHSLNILQSLTEVELKDIKYYHFKIGILAGTRMIISRTGYTGELGFELYFPARESDGGEIWEKIMGAGRAAGIGPAGLGARDTLRLEMGYLLYGNDMDEKTNPLEAGLGWITKFDKGLFIGRDALLPLREGGIQKKLVGLKIQDQAGAKRAIPRHGYPVVHSGEEIGTVTSGTLSPSLQTSIALAYVRPEYAGEGTTLEVSVRGNNFPFTVVKPPFLSR